MKLTFKESVPTAATKEDIILDGQNIGTMEMSFRETDGKPRYFAIIRLEGQFSLSADTLVMGHGSTREDAINNAIADNRSSTLLRLEKINELARKMEG